MSEVPLVDLTPWYGGTDGERRGVAQQVDEALRTIGFLLVVGHGVPRATRTAARDAARAFFARPDEEKRAIATSLGGRGWLPPGIEANAYAEGVESPPDLKESFVVGLEVADAAGIPGFATTNVWPDRPDGFRTAIEAHLAAVGRVAADLLELFAVGLDLPPSFFRDRARSAVGAMNVNWYPPRTAVGDPLPGQFRIGAHSDFGALTVLDREDGRGALQVCAPDGAWLDAPFDPEAFTINVGDLMARWTGDRWRSTRHRVLPPPSDAPDEELLSLVYFQPFAADTIVEPLDTPAAGPNRYEPVTAGDYLRERVDTITV